MSALRTAFLFALSVPLSSCSLLPQSSTSCKTLGQCEPLRIVLGQADDHSNNRLRYGMQGPAGALIAGGRLFVSDTLNHRILIWNSVPVSDGQAPDVVLGQPDLTTADANHGGRSAMTLASPTSLTSDGQKLFVADSENNRILIWNQLPTRNATPADVVLGQPDFTTFLAVNFFTTPNPQRVGSILGFSRWALGIEVKANKLIATDPSFSRVLIWDPIPTTNNAPAQVVLGQMSFTTGDRGASATMMTVPSGRPATNGTQLFVSDTYNNRVLGWTMNFPSVNQAAANVALGQMSMTAMASNAGGNARPWTLSVPNAATIANNQLYVVDHLNSRILIWSTLPTATGQAANIVLGQPSLTFGGANNPVLDAKSLAAPRDVWTDGTRTVVADTENHRALLFNTSITSTQQAANNVVGQPNMTSGEIGGSPSVSASEMSYPVSLARCGNHLYVADEYANRVLVYAQMPSQTAAPADFVLGQPNMTSTAPQPSGIGAGTLLHPNSVTCEGDVVVVADNGNNRVLIYTRPIVLNQQPADLVLGQRDFSTAASNQGGAQTGLFSPSAVQLRDGKLYVADALNHRVLIWNQLPSANQQPADLVVGQTTLTGISVNAGRPGPDRDTLSWPNGMFTDGARLFVSDTLNQRVLIWNQLPTANGAPADVVLGQVSFTSADNARAIADNILRLPLGLVLDGERLYVTDASDHRVLYWNQVPTRNDQSSDGVIGQSNTSTNVANSGGLRLDSLQQPSAILPIEDTLAIADSMNGRIVFVQPPN